jgi:hypothetical protein
MNKKLRQTIEDHKGDTLPLTLTQAKTLRNGDTLYNRVHLNSTGLSRVRVTSVKTWKRSPERVQVNVKYGMYTFFSLNEIDLDDWTLDDTPAYEETN